jgi:rhomboid protease GluP
VAPATYFLVGVNVAVFLLMAFRFSSTSPSSEQLLAFGADNGGKVLIEGEWWRLVTSTFVHAGPLHIATNMWCLWNLGLLGEPLLGSFGTIAVYLLTGVAGNLLSIAVNPGAYGESNGIVGVGASGAVFDNMAHLGGFLSGLALGVPLVPRIGSRREDFTRRQWVAFAGLAFFLALLGYGIFTFHHSQA